MHIDQLESTALRHGEHRSALSGSPIINGPGLERARRLILIVAHGEITAARPCDIRADPTNRHAPR